MKLLIQQKIQAGFAVALAFLLLIGVTAWWSEQRNAETFRSVERSYQVLDHFETMLVEMLNTETGSRGFAISGDETFLQPQQIGIAAIQESLTAAKRLTQDNPDQQRRLAALEPLIQEKISRANTVVKLRRSGDTAGAFQFIATGQGKAVMDEIRKLIAEMEAAEEQLLRQRTARSQAMARTTQEIVAFGGVLALGLVGLASAIVRRDFEKRQRAEMERDRFFTLSLDMLCIAKTGGYFKRLNPAFTATLGWSMEELLARPFLNFVHPDDRAATLREVEKLAAGQPTLHFENRYQCKDGAWKTLAWRAVPQADGTIYCTGRDMTELKQAQADLEYERYLLHALMNNVTISIYFKDLKSRFLRSNQAQATRFGFADPMQTVGKTDFDFFSMEHATQAYEDEQQIIRTGEPVNKEEMETWPDGRKTWVLSSKLPLRDKHGQIVGTFGISHDITERKQLVDALRRSEQNLAVTLDSIGDAVLATDTEGRVIRLNPIAEKLMGWTQAETLGRPVAEVFRIINEDTGEPAVIPVENVLATGEIHGLANHTVLVARDGTERPVADSAAPIRDKDGRIFGVVLVFRDVTVERAAQRALRDSEARYRTLFNSIDEGFCIIEMIFDEQKKPVDYRFLEVNPSFEKQTGLPDVLGKRMLELAPQHEAHWFETYGRIAVTGEAARFQNHAEQLHRWFDVYAFRFGEPKNWQVAILFNDITGRKQMEKGIAQLNTELHERAAQLKAANKELEAFSYTVSHDLRAPLRHIQGYIQMLTTLIEGQLTDKARHYLKTITDASTEMGQLIDDLLAFSRMGRVEMIQESVAPDSLLHEILRGLEMAVQGRNIEWQIAPLPQVVGDSSMLRQVLANLVGNAVKYTRPRNPARIEIGCAGEEDGRIFFFVRDNGAGFDMQYAHKLFGVFQRLHRAEDFEGTGIGLATVRRIIARHGGRTWAEGALDQGATFYFTLKPATTV